MSRIDEALRLASEQAPAESAASSDESRERDQVPELNAHALAREPFPLEMPERRPPQKSGPSIVPAVGAAAAAPRSQLAAPPAPKRTSLFERINGTLSKKVVIDTNMLPASREQYRRLAATLHHAQAASGLKVVMIASAVQGEGKTLTATNLALTMSESYQRNVLLIDADLRRPTLHTVFAVDNTSGLSEGLTSRTQNQLPVRQVSPRLAILPAGRPSSDPMAGLTSERMHQVIDEARGVFDWVIIDTPPVVLLTDANLLSAMVDGAILVVKAESTSADFVNRALAAIGRERVLGVVLNRATESPHTAYGYYSSYYDGSREATPQG